SFIVDHGLLPVFAERHGWIAAYPRSYQPDPATEAAIPHCLWQYPDRASFPGVAGGCDASVFRGDLDHLLALIGGTMDLSPADLDLIQERARLGTLAALKDATAFGDLDPGQTIRETHDRVDHLVNIGETLT